MNEPKDDLLAAFENPDMAVSEMPQQEAVPNTVPVAPAAPVQPTPVAPVQNVASVQNVQAAPVNPAPVGPQVAPVAPAPVAETPVAPVPPAVEDNQNTMPNVSEEPAVAVTQSVREEEPKEESSVKKNLAFIIAICVIIAVFILFLPKIMGLLNGGSY